MKLKGLVVGERTLRNEDIEYFGGLRNEDKSIKITSMFKNQNAIKVKTDDTKFDEIGMVNFYGVVTKHRSGTSKFHERYMVMRGFNIYWYKNINAEAQKGMCPVPNKPIVAEMINNKKCFALQKEDGNKESRRMVF
jgi:hypothetical protein